MTGRRVDLRDDRGTTLMELVVAMGLLSIFMAIFTAAIFEMTSTTSKVQGVAESADQTNSVFLALDRSVRYATGISTPSTNAAGTWHVEYAAADLSDGTAREMCTQLRVSDGQLQRRTWVVSGSSHASGSLTSWKPLASGVTNGGAAAGEADQPFSTPTSATPSAFQRLTVTTLTAAGPTNAPSATRATSTFTALNSTAGAESSVCQQVPVEQPS
ncbi:MAG: prepilin-type N-terminal cleavage/methylation domain-containing protein [Nocardioidaceae bacterium]|nr:prepilin-type N-terminal cleavage/methylation domain-containing protein [Nocardioidaceae bacterium]